MLEQYIEFIKSLKLALTPNFIWSMEIDWLIHRPDDYPKKDDYLLERCSLGDVVKLWTNGVRTSKELYKLHSWKPIENLPQANFKGVLLASDFNTDEHIRNFKLSLSELHGLLHRLFPTNHENNEPVGFKIPFLDRVLKEVIKDEKDIGRINKKLYRCHSGIRIINTGDYTSANMLYTCGSVQGRPISIVSGRENDRNVHAHAHTAISYSRTYSFMDATFQT